MSSRLPPKIIVIGAGVNGLASAVSIQTCCPEADVEIVAEKLSPNTTSEVSAGFWAPFGISGTDPEVVRKLCSLTHEYLTDLAYSPLAGEIGVQKLSGYYLYDDEIKDEHEALKCAADGYRRLTPKELARFPLAKSGFFHTAVQVDVTPYLQWLTKRFIQNGGRIHIRKVASLNELAGHCDLVVNCSGLGARELLKDDQIFPTRGQVWRVDAPWIKHFYLFKPKNGLNQTYILPGVKNVVLGSIAQAGDWRTEVSDEDSIELWQRAQTFLPSLARARPVRVTAGLRPTRTSLRLETELLDVNGKTLKVVHNYGHGGSGITLHWGCAVEVTKLALQSLGYPTTPVEKLKSRM